MRLEDLFEDPEIDSPKGKKGRTITYTLHDLYRMTNTTIPTVIGPNGRPGYSEQQQKDLFTPRTMTIDPNDPNSVQFADGIQAFKAGGGVAGRILKDNELRPYNENFFLEDWAWQFAASSAELASGWIKGGAGVAEDVLNYLTPQGITYQVGSAIAQGDISKRGKLYDFKNSVISGYDDPDGDKFFMDEFEEYLRNKTDKQFRAQIDATAGAVNTVEDAGKLFQGTTGFNLEGMAGIMIGELPSEIVDVAAVTLGRSNAIGMAVTGLANAFEAGGHARQSITDRINQAYKKGVLQQEPLFQTYVVAAFDQISSEEKENPTGRTQDQIYEEAMDMARRHAIDMSAQNAFYKVAVTGGVIDAVTNQILYKGPITAGFLRNAITKGTVGTLGEGVSEYWEQKFENLGIIDGAGNITTADEGTINAAYNGMIAAQTGNTLATTVDAGIRTKGALGRFVQFVNGGSSDPDAILDIMTMDPKVLIDTITHVDPETGIARFSMAEAMKKRLVTSDFLTAEQKKEINSGWIRKKKIKVIGPDGNEVEIDKDILFKNDRAVAVVGLLDNNEIDVKEGTATIILGSENEVRELAGYLAIKEIDGKKVTKKTDINLLLRELENVRKLDIRVEGRSTLEPPIWSDLDDVQRMQYWKEGKVTFSEGERRNQVWTRQQIQYNSRRMKDDIPDDIANLRDNTIAYPTAENSQLPIPIGSNQKKAQTVAERIKELEAQIESSSLLKVSNDRLSQDQADWDAEYGATHNADGSPKDPNAEGIAGRQLTRDDSFDYGPNNGARPTENNVIDDPYNFTGARAGSSTLINEVNNLKKKLEQDQKQWTAKFGKTHHRDGTVVFNRKYYDAEIREKIRIAKEYEEKLKAANAELEKDLASEEGEKWENVEITDKPSVPSKNDKDDKIVRSHIIHGAKMDIANMKMEKDALQFMLDKLETEFPGISDQIISPDDLSNYKKTNTEVISNIEKSVPKLVQPQKKAPRPPRGTQITIDNQPYVYLGNDVAGMWAKVKEDGSVGSTVHTNHEQLMKSWRDENFRGKEAELMQTPERDDSPAIVDQGGNVVIDVQTTAPKPPAVDDGAEETPTLGPISPSPKIVKPGQLGDPQPSGTLPNFDADSDAEARRKEAEAKRKEAEAKRKEAERQAQIIADLEAEADAAAAEAEAEAKRKEAEAKARRDAEREKTPDLRIGGANFEVPGPKDAETNITNKEKIPGQTTGDGPVKFVPQDKLTKDQQDAIAGRGKYKVDKGAEDKEKAQSNIDDYKQKQGEFDADAEVTPNLDPDGPNAQTDPTQTKIDPTKTDPTIAVLPNTTATVKDLKLDTQKKDKLTKKDQNQKTPRIKGGLGAGSKGDDSLGDLMKFYPAKYQDPLDLDKYKGGMAKARGALSK